MELFAPDYYRDFKCIADKCHHSCCIGWEIDIDEDTFEYYRNLDEEIGERLKENIAVTDGTPHFILSKDERCPFLAKNGLCDIISDLGEGALCQICADHPRYRNFFNTRTEIGLGLCCEETCRIILGKETKTVLCKIETDSLCDEDEEETAFFAFRKKITDILQDRKFNVNTRIENLLDFCEIKLPEKPLSEWAQIYLKLERLDEEWTSYLELLNLPPSSSTLEFETAFEQLITYFIYRHLSDGFYDMRINERLLFCVLSTKIIKAICGAYYDKHGVFEFENLLEIARLYSSEIEYSEENIEMLLNELTIK